VQGPSGDVGALHFTYPADGVTTTTRYDGLCRVIAEWADSRATSTAANAALIQTTIEEMQARGVNILESPDAYSEAEISSKEGLRDCRCRSRDIPCGYSG
jgi:hypothetical protein